MLTNSRSAKAARLPQSPGHPSAGFIGVGEGVDDLKPFVAAEFVGPWSADRSTWTYRDGDDA
jgi:hypothetical protein